MWSYSARFSQQLLKKLKNCCVFELKNEVKREREILKWNENWDWNLREFEIYWAHEEKVFEFVKKSKIERVIIGKA